MAEISQTTKAAFTRNQTTFWIVLIVSLLLPQLPLVNLLVLPITQFTTAVHELGHAFMCIMTGGTVTGLTIVSDGMGHGGLTNCRGGNVFLFSQAGYLGTAVFGCLLIYLGQFEKLSKTIVGMIGITMVVASLSLVGFNIGRTGCQGFFSLIWGLAIGAFFLWAGVKWKPSTANLLLLFVAIQTALNSLTSIMALFQGGLIGLGPWSDATNMQAMTGIPAVVWSLLWIAISVGMVALTLKYTYFRGLIKSDS